MDFTRYLARNKLLCLKNAGAQISVFHLIFLNNRHLWQLKKSLSWGYIWSYQLNSPFTSKTHFDFFFNCHGCRTFFLVEIHCYLSALKFDIITYSKAVCLPWMDCDKFFSRSNIHQNSRTISTLMNLPMNFEGFIGVEI